MSGWAKGQPKRWKPWWGRSGSSRTGAETIGRPITGHNGRTRHQGANQGASSGSRALTVCLNRLDGPFKLWQQRGVNIYLDLFEKKTSYKSFQNQPTNQDLFRYLQLRCVFCTCIRWHYSTVWWGFYILYTTLGSRSFTAADANLYWPDKELVADWIHGLVLFRRPRFGTHVVQDKTSKWIEVDFRT